MAGEFGAYLAFETALRLPRLVNDDSTSAAQLGRALSRGGGEREPSRRSEPDSDCATLADHIALTVAARNRVQGLVQTYGDLLHHEFEKPLGVSRSEQPAWLKDDTLPRIPFGRVERIMLDLLLKTATLEQIAEALTLTERDRWPGDDLTELHYMILAKYDNASAHGEPDQFYRRLANWSGLQLPVLSGPFPPADPQLGMRSY